MHAKALYSRSWTHQTGHTPKIDAIIDFVFEDDFRGANRKWSVEDTRTLAA
jgi:hypothetical protein